MRQTTAFEVINLADQYKKREATELLMMKVMSIKESCFEDDEDGGYLRVAKYFVGRLEWESRQIKKINKKPDMVYTKIADHQS